MSGEGETSRATLGIFLIVIFVATSMFAYHTQIIVRRYLDGVVAQASYAVSNQSVILPSLTLYLESKRYETSNVPPLKRPKFYGHVDDGDIPDWAYTMHHSDMQHYWALNYRIFPFCIYARKFLLLRSLKLSEQLTVDF